MKNLTKLMGTLVATSSMVSNLAFADGSLSLDYRLQNAKTKEITKVTSQPIPLAKSQLFGKEIVSTHHELQKSLYLIDLGNSLKASLKAYEDACKKIDVRPSRDKIDIQVLPSGKPVVTSKGSLALAAPSNLIAPPPSFPPILPPGPPSVDKCKAPRLLVADKLLETIRKFQTRLVETKELRNEEQLFETLDLVRKLAKNMKEAKVYPRHHLELAKFNGLGGGPAVAVRAGGLNLTSDGALDFESFKKQVNEGFVPSASSLPMEGFLGEFDLSLSGFGCEQLVCMNAGTLIDPVKRKLFVQLHMGSNVTTETFKRAPLNLSVVLDVSGSMSSQDNTEKSRLEWAKEALNHIVAQLNEQDSLSIVLFDTDSEILLQTTEVTNKEAILELIKKLETKGSTNLEKGLRDGFELVSENFKQGYENRVILISDAGLNTGVTTEGSLVKLVSDYAAEDIGLSAIGLGLNFNQDFIQAITMSKGGNYQFMNSGKAMFKLVKNFDFLVTPVAYNLKASVNLEGIEAKLVKTYGVPMKEDEPTRDLIDVRTLFFSEAGGAIILEYQF